MQVCFRWWCRWRPGCASATTATPWSSRCWRSVSSPTRACHPACWRSTASVWTMGRYRRRCCLHWHESCPFDTAVMRAAKLTSTTKLPKFPVLYIITVVQLHAVVHRVSLKGRHHILDGISVRSWPVLKILSLTASLANLQWNSYKKSHHTLLMLPHYLGKH